MDKYPKRKPTRLKTYDYSKAGYYYVTICVEDRKELFGEILSGKMILNKTGQIVNECWKDISNKFTDVALDEYCIMPNHMHGIIILRRGLIHQTRDNILIQNKSNNKSQNNIDDYNTGQKVTGMINHAPTDWMLMKNHKITLGKIVRYFKARASKIIHDSNKDNFIWQRSFYDHIIRNDKSLNKIREYIINNPKNWELDENNINSLEV